MVDREMLLDLQGRSRKPQFALAKKWGITDFPNPGGGCLLTDPPFSQRLRDLFDHQTADITRTDLELLTIGRHLRVRPDLKIIAGRDEKDNERLAGLARDTDTLISLVDFPGPIVLIPGDASGEDCLLGARICVSFSSARTQGRSRCVSAPAKKQLNREGLCTAARAKSTPGFCSRLLKNCYKLFINTSDAGRTKTQRVRHDILFSRSVHE